MRLMPFLNQEVNSGTLEEPYGVLYTVRDGGSSMQAFDVVHISEIVHCLAAVELGWIVYFVFHRRRCTWIILGWNCDFCMDIWTLKDGVLRSSKKSERQINSQNVTNT